MAYAGGFPAKKNAEFLLVFPIFDADGDLVSNAADLDSEVSKDGGSFIDCTNEAAEIGTSGIYKLTLTATEMNADIIAVITKTSTTGAKTTSTIIYTSAYQIAQMRGTDDAITSLAAITDDKDSYKADVSNLDVKVSSRSTLGVGAITWIYTLTEESTGNPIPDADVWVTSDEAGNNVLASGKTDGYGKVTFHLDTGTVYVWRQKSGWDFDNPDTEVVS